jgi:hypothetical protein
MPKDIFENLSTASKLQCTRQFKTHKPVARASEVGISFKPLLNRAIYRAGTHGSNTACSSRCSHSTLQGGSQDLTQDLLDCSPFEGSNLGKSEIPPSLRSLNELIEIAEELWYLSFFATGSTLSKAEALLLAV